MTNTKHLLYDYLIAINFSEKTAQSLNMLGLVLALLIVVFITDLITRKLLLNAFTRFAIASKTNFDDLLVKNKVPRNIAHIIPLIIALNFIQDVLDVKDLNERVLKTGSPGS